MPAECRICLKTKREVSSLFEKDLDQRKYADKISEFSSIKIFENDGLPDHICGVCIRTLHSVFVFKQLCRDSDAKLRTRNGMDIEYLDKDIEDVNNFITTTRKISDIVGIKDEELEFEVAHDDDHFDTSMPFEYDTEVTEVAETDPNALVLKRINPDITIVKIEPMSPRRIKVEKSTRKPRRRKNLDLDDTSPNKVERKRNTPKYSDSTFEVQPLKIESNVPRVQYVNEKILPPRKVVKIPKLAKPKMEERQYFCEICGKCFKNRSILESHVLRHAGIKPHQCSDCGKSFVLKSELRRHTFIHTGVRPYPCRYCGRAFADYSSKIKHERCHLNERMYKCEMCGNGFNYSYALKKHMLVHTGAKNFFCTLCQQSFRMKYHLANHIRRRHKELDSVQKERLMVMGDLLAAMAENKNDLNQVDNVSIKVVEDEDNIPQVYVSLGN